MLTAVLIACGVMGAAAMAAFILGLLRHPGDDAAFAFGISARLFVLLAVGLVATALLGFQPGAMLAAAVMSYTTGWVALNLSKPALK